MNGPSAGDQGRLSLTQEGRVDEACDRFEAAWRGGRRPLIEQELGETPEPGRSALLRELLALELTYRRQAGESPTMAEYRERFPGSARLVESVFAAATSTMDRALSGDVGRSDSGPWAAEPLDLAIGSTFGRYRIERRLGGGGMGAVYLAHDTRLDRPVALKIPRFLPDDGSDARERFHREARSAASLRHPNLCAVHDVGQIDGVPYLTMDYIEGRPLSDLAGGAAPPPPRRAAEIVAVLASAMAAAHRRGVIHRDLKPSNVISSPGGELVIVDFGLARRPVNELTITADGQVLGTPEYMSPEQARGGARRVDGRTDIYSLGIILYQLLTGRCPFQGPDAAKVLYRIVYDEPPPPSAHREGLDPDLEAICLRAMAKRAEDRFATMDELAAALRAYLRGGGRTPEPGPPAHRPGITDEASAGDAERAETRSMATDPFFAGLEIRPTSTDQGAGPASVRRRGRSARLGLATAGVAALGVLGVIVARGLPDDEGDAAPAPPRVQTPEGVTNSIGMRLVTIPAGEFDMGSPEEDPEATDDEKPRHRVRITRPFDLGAYEVTQGEYRAVMGENPSRYRDSDRLPVETVSWFDAIRFCNRLSEKEGLPPYYNVSATAVTIAGGEGYRLPTEAEWEYACRAGSTTRYTFGDDPAQFSDFAWFGEGPNGRTHEVGRKRPNAWGLYDLLGNVSEWCWDFYLDGYYRRSPVDDPTGPAIAASRVPTRILRGGAFRFEKTLLLRSADRSAGPPEVRPTYAGFRVARTPRASGSDGHRRR